MRGWVKGSIAVLAAALVCAVGAPGASAAQAPEETEGVYLELTPRKHVRVVVEVHPQLGFAEVYTEMGVSTGWVPRRRSGSVVYAVRIPKGPLEGSLDLTILGVASVVGELNPADEGLEFNGSFHFTGKGGYLSFDADHVTGGRLSGPVLCAEECRGSNPSLFEYIDFPPEVSNQNTQVLYAEQNLGHRVTHFQATHYLHDPHTTFEAQSLEWLRGHVATVRTLEVEKAPGADFKVSSKAEHPKSATAEPPAPFSGSAAYRSAGTIRTPRSGKLTGSLSVDIYGVKVRLAGPRAKTSLFNFYPGL